MTSELWYQEDAKTRTLAACATLAQPSWLRVPVASSYRFLAQCVAAPHLSCRHYPEIVRLLERWPQERLCLQTTEYDLGR